MKKQPALLLFTIFLLPVYFLDAQQPRLIVPIGHTDKVYEAHFSPDGKKVVTASRDQTAKIWDAQSGMLIANLQGHTNSVNTACFSPDGKRVLTASDDSTAKLWDAESGAFLTNLKGHIAGVISACFSSDGKKIVTASYDNTAKIWDAQTGTLLVDLKGHFYEVRSACFSPDDKKILTASDDSTAKIWHAKTGALLITLKRNPAALSDAFFSPDGKDIVTISDTSKLWDAQTGAFLRNVQGRNFQVSTASFSPDGRKIVLASYKGKAEIWDTKTWRFLTRLNGHTNGVNSISFSPDGKKIVTASEDHTAKVWNATTGALLANLEGHDYEVYEAYFSRDGKKIVTASPDSTAKIWDAKNGRLIADLKGHTYDVHSACFTLDGTKIITAGGNITKIWDARSGVFVGDLKGPSGWIEGTSFSPDGKKFVTSADASLAIDSIAKIYDTQTGNVLAVLKGHFDRVNTECFSTDGKKIVTSSDDHTAKIWNAQDGKLIANLEGHDQNVISATFSPDNKRVVTTSYDDRIKVWDAENGSLLNNFGGFDMWIRSACFSADSKRIYAESRFSPDVVETWDAQTAKSLAYLKGHTREIISASFSPDGKKMVTASEDHTAKIWSTVSGELLNDLTGHINWVWSAYFSPDGKKIITASSDNTSKIWDADKGVLLYTFFALDSTDYFIQVPSSYYMCTPGAAKLLHYVTDDLKVITFAQLDLKYNRPDVVLAAVGYSDTALISSYRNVYYKRIKKLNIDTSAFREDYSVPEADFINRDSINTDQANKTLTLHIQGKDSAYLLDRFNVWINQVPLFGVRGINIRTRNSNRFDTCFTITLSQGANQIETSITNVNGTESYRMPLLVRYSPAQPKKEKLYFIGIGINHFADRNYNLQWSVKDIRDLSLKLKEKYKNNIEIDTLFDENVTVTKVMVLKKKLEFSSIDDKVIVAYSGHGLLSSAYDYYLSTYAVNFDHPEQNGLPYDELDNLLDSIPARKKLMLIDACHSGEVDKEEMEQYRQVKNKLDSLGVQKGVTLVPVDSSKIGMKGSVELMQELFVNVAKSTGATIISAAAGTQFALEKNNLQNGVFTYSILEYMQQHGHVTVNELQRYVNQRVVELTAGMQVPTTRNENIELNWEVW